MEAERRLDGEESERAFTPADAKINNAFLRCMRNRKISLEQQVAGSLKFGDERLSDHLAYQALPPAEEMAKILRYERRVKKQLDWALQKLLECPQRRSLSRSVQGPVLVPLPNNAKRSQ